ncbi:MAG: hypothetical protein C3L24_00420, partial [Candidatus Sedimenticola endophacoides]
HGTEIRGQGAAVKIATHAQAVNGEKSQRFLGRLGHGATSFSFTEAFLAKYQLYQLVERGAPFFMNNSG